VRESRHPCRPVSQASHDLFETPHWNEAEAGDAVDRDEQPDNERLSRQHQIDAFDAGFGGATVGALFNVADAVADYGGTAGLVPLASGPRPGGAPFALFDPRDR
jgi:hypothetical protein